MQHVMLWLPNIAGKSAETWWTWNTNFWMCFDLSSTFFRIFWQHYCMWTHISFQFLQFLLAEFPYMSWACRRPLLRPRESHRTGMSRFKHIPKMGESEPWSPRHFCFYFWDVHKFHNGYFQKSYISVFDPRPQLYICFCCWGMTGMTLPKARVSSFHHRTYESDTSFFRQVLQGTTPKFNVEHHGTWWTSHLQKKTPIWKVQNISQSWSENWQWLNLKIGKFKTI